MLITILIFIAILLVLVLSHEAGHFFSARLFGIKVEEFGFGIPPRIAGIRSKKGILYSFNLLPFGGFVKIFGEEGESASNPESFGSKPAYARASVLGAGIAANILLAYLVFSALLTFGIPEVVPEDQAVGKTPISILDVSPNSPAYDAGFFVSDQIKKIASESEEIFPSKIQDVQDFISKNKGKLVKILFERNGSSFEKEIYPRSNPPEGEGPLGVSLGFLQLKKTPFYRAPIEGAVLTGQVIRATLFGFYDIVTALFKDEAAKIEVAGPVGIFNLVSLAKSSGFRSLLMFLGLLSVNLAIINLLPIPGLDGGRLFFLLIESARGSRISPRTSNLFHTAGLIALIALMLLITYHDLIRLFKI